MIGDQCQYGLRSHDGTREGLAKKSTGFLTNSPFVAKQLERRCPNRAGVKKHDHVRLEHGRARKAQEYPDGLCKAICRGIKEQLEADRTGQVLLKTTGNGSEAELRGAGEEIKRWENKCKTVEEDLSAKMEAAWDDVSGAALDLERVKQARKEDIEYVHKMGLYQKVPVSECVRATGRQPISARWIGINKGDNENPNYRSRLVAREINTHKREDLFAATPPLEAMKAILSLTTQQTRERC